MRLGLITGSLVLLFLLVTYSWFEEVMVAVFHTHLIVWPLRIGIAVWIAWAVIKGMIKRRQAVQEIVARARADKGGPLESWFLKQHEWDDVDRIPLGMGKSITYKAYGGRRVVGVLLKEGFKEVLARDVVNVFGRERGKRIYSDIFNDINDGSLIAGVAGTIAGFKLGMDWGRR